MIGQDVHYDLSTIHNVQVENIIAEWKYFIKFIFGKMRIKSVRQSRVNGSTVNYLTNF